MALRADLAKGRTNLSIVSVGGIAILLVMVIYTFWVWGDDNK